MRSIASLFSFFLLVSLCGCTTQKTFHNSGALNTISLELADDNVNYERLNSEFNRKTFGGILVGASSQNVFEANIITNNNGKRQRSAVPAFGSKVFPVLSLIAISVGSYLGISGGGELKPLAGLVALGVGFALNEPLCRPFNRQLITADAVRNTMRQNPDADFYSFPFSKLEVEPWLLGTQWNGSYRIVSGNISDDVFIATGNVSDDVRDRVEVSDCTNMMACNYNADATADDGSCSFAKPNFDCEGNCLYDVDMDGVCDEFEIAGCTDMTACSNYNADATDDDGSCIFAETNYDCAGNCLYDIDMDGVCDEFEPRVRGKLIELGSTGEYTDSKNRLVKFAVIEILNFKGGDNFKIRLVVNAPNGQYRITIKATDKKLTFD